jgi:hypothetical protein
VVFGLTALFNPIARVSRFPGSSPAAAIDRDSGGWDDGQLHEARAVGFVEDPLGGHRIILALLPEDSGHGGLGVAVVQRERA